MSRGGDAPGFSPVASDRMNDRILVTGSEGLVGRVLRQSLAARGSEIVGLDLRGSGCERGDVRDGRQVCDAIAGCRGIVHLAAVSRVVWAERAPDICRDTNIGGLRCVLEAALDQPACPWFLFASSREVYGQPGHLPATEDTPLSPVNVYGRSKVEGERLVEEARASGLRTATVRLSNVYGSILDHPDRVVPAFAHAAVEGRAIRIDGAECIFDFTHIEDTVRGMVAVMERLDAGETLPPLHLLTGEPTTLRELAAMATACAGKRLPIVEAPPRPFDVSRFHGDPSRAREFLGWEPRVGLRDGFGRLVRDLRARSGAIMCEMAAP
ncbi:MAG: NAD(P)-dependent oxidoreductase [Rhodospirillaceae bacterium]|nr:NAD(P)-dependent oxidoreductase [Rhodospirillaceae bacterium]